MYRERAPTDPLCSPQTGRARGGPTRSELAIAYDRYFYPLAASCTCCGERMPDPPKAIGMAADVVLWFSQQFLEHKKRKHPDSSKNTDDKNG